MSSKNLLSVYKYLVLTLCIVCGYSSLNGQTPTVSVSAPSSAHLGEQFSVEVALDNTDASLIGYDPVVELILPALPDDGEGGAFPDTVTAALSLTDAEYLGGSVVVEFVGNFDSETLELVNPLTGEIVTGGAGNAMYLLHYPLSSIAPDQPAPVLELDLTIDPLTPIELKQVQVRGIFNYGNDPSGQSPAIAGSAVSSAVSPTLLLIRKEVSYPESETATGPSFPGTWSLVGDIAAGASLENVVFTDSLPDNFYVTAANIIRPAGGTLQLTGSNPGYSLTASWPTADGSTINSGSEILIEVEGYVPESDASDVLVLPPSVGESQVSNTLYASYDFERVGIEPAGGLSYSLDSGEVLLDALTLAVQKTASVVNDTLPAGATPGDTVEYVLNLQVSDFKQLDDLEIVDGITTAAGLITEADILGDALTFQSSFVPEYSATMGGVAVSGTFDAANYSVTADPAGYDAGTSQITFDLSQQLIDDGHYAADGILTGAQLLDPISGSGTTAVITYRATIDTDFDSPVSGDASVDVGDLFHNSVDVVADDLIDSIIVGDESSATLSAPAITLNHTIERIVTVEGVVNDAVGESPSISPGDVVTFSIQVSVPTGDIEDFVIEDFIPYSLFSVNDVNGDGTDGDMPVFNASAIEYPEAGVVAYGLADEYAGNYNSYGDPSFSYSVTNNSFKLDYGSIDTPTNADANGDGVYEFELRYTMVAGIDDLADGFEMTSLVQVEHESTNGGSGDQRAYAGLLFSKSVPVLTKGVVASSSLDAVISPAASGAYDDAGSDGNCSGARAGDTVRFAITLQNTGSDPLSYLEIADVLPAGLDATQATIVSVNRADGVALVMSPVIDGLANSADELALFGSGLALDSSVAGNYLSAGSGSAGAPYGAETLVLLLDVPVEDTVAPASSLVNSASASVWYADSVPTDGPYAQVSDTAIVATESIQVEKQLVYGGYGDEPLTGIVDNNGTSVATATIGEIMSYEVTLQVPQGEVTNVVLSDVLPSGLVSAEVGGVRAEVVSMDASISSSKLSAGATDASDADITASSSSISFDFGTLVRPVSVDTELKEIVVRIYAYVDDVATNVGGREVNNTATLTWDGGSASGSDDFTVVRPNVVLGKSMSAVVSGDLQAGSTVLVTLTIDNPGDVWDTSAAHDFTIEDTVQSAYFDTSSIQEVFTPEGYVFSTQADGDDVKVVYSSVDLDVNASASFSFNVDILSTISLPVDLQNYAIASGTSLPSDPPSGVESSETDDENVELASNQPTVTKSLLSSSESHTTDSPLRATIGEQLVYRLKVNIPEGQLPDLQVRDKVPAGLDFVGTNTDALLAYPGVGYSISGPLASVVNAAFTGISDSDPTPSSSDTNDGSSDDIYFNFGAIQNFPDGDDSNDYFYIDLELVVLDLSSVVGYGDSPSVLRNRAQVTVTGMGSGEGNSNRVSATIVEPNLAITKDILEASGDGGDTFTVEISVTNNGDSEAYDVVIEDPIPGVHFDTTQIGLGLSAPTGWTLSLESAANDSEDDVTVLIASDAGTALAVGETATFQFTIVADADIAAPAVIVNTATVREYSTLDGSLTHPSGTTERTSGGEQDTADINISNASLQLSYVSSSESYTSDAGVYPKLTFGERAVMRVDVELPDGALSNPTLYLQLPVGLDFVGVNSDASLTYPSAGYSSFSGDTGALAAAAFVGVVDADASAGDSQTLDGSGVDVGFAFNTIINAADGDDTNDSFYFFVEVVCMDESALVGLGETPSTLATSVRMDGGGITGMTTGSVVVELAEPQLAITKTMSALSADQPDETTVTIVVTNDGDSPAHDIRIEDVLDASQFDLATVALDTLPNNYDYNFADGAVIFTSNGASIATGESATFTFKVNVLASAVSPVMNLAEVTESSSLDHASGQPNGIGERDGAQVQSEYELPLPQIEALKRATDLDYTGAPLLPGDRIGYTITVQNTGGASASVVTLMDSIPDNTTYIADSLLVDGVAQTPSLPDMSLDLGTMNTAASKVVYFEVEVNASLPSDAYKIVNSASATFAERSTLEVSDNDPNGHDPMEDDGVDDANDSGSSTADDDPTVLYLMQGATTMRSYLAFEDLKNRGWSDWDHNDILLDITTHYLTDGNGDVESVIVLYQIIARGASFDAEVYLTMPLQGNVTWKSSYLESDGTFISSTAGSDFNTVTADVFASTRDAMPPNVNTRYSWGPSRTERFDATEPGKRAVVQLTLAAADLNPLSTFSVSPHDTWAHILNTGEDIHRVQYEVGNTQLVWEGPLAGRSLPFVVEFDDGFDWPAEFQPIWESHPDYEDYVKSGETLDLDWWRRFDPDLVWVDDEGQTPGVGVSIYEAAPEFNLLLSAPAMSNSVSSSSTNWPQTLGGQIVASPVLRDLDGDGDREVLIGARDAKVYIYDHLGNPLTGWPQETKADLSGRFGVVSSPAVGDIDNDGALEVVCGSLAGHLYAWELDGSVISGFPVYLGRSIKSVCAVVDVDGNAGAEIIAHAGKSELYVIDGSGQNVTGWPVQLGGDEDQFDSWIWASSPVVFDLGMDGSLQIAVGSTADQVHIFNLDGTVVDGWPVTTGDWVYPTVTPVDLDGDFEPEIVAGSGDGKLYAWKADGTVVSGFPITLDSPVIGSVAAADITEDGQLELVVATYGGMVYMFDQNGSGFTGWPKTTGGAIVASPIIIDGDADGALDVIVGSRDNTLYAWSRDGVAINSLTLDAGDWIDATAAAADIDADGLVELVYASYNMELSVVQLTTAATDANLPWPSLRGDTAEAGDLVITDRDEDGLPDALEMAYFNGLDEDASGDFDKDGHDNLAEWIAGTDASSASDFLSLDIEYIFGVDGGSDKVRLSWDARAGRTYTCTTCQGLVGEMWTTNEGAGKFYLETDQVMNHEMDAPLQQQFYQIQVERGDQR